MSDLVTRYVLEARDAKGKVMGYLGRKCVISDAGKFILSPMLRPTMVAPDRMFDREDKKYSEKVEALCKKHGIKSEEKHCCSLKFRTRLMARETVQTVKGNFRDVQFFPIAIKFEWGKLHTAIKQ